MSLVHVSIDIKAPPEAVFDTIMDPQRLGDWVTIHRSVSNVSHDSERQGARMDQVLCMRGVNFKVHWTLIDVNRPKEAEWEGRGPALSKARIHYRLSGDPDGPTKFDYTNEFHAPGGLLGAMASRVLVGHASEREARQSLNRLKDLVESR
jgi:carbon monoxide dehydrogenase subunit G